MQCVNAPACPLSRNISGHHGIQIQPRYSLAGPLDLTEGKRHRKLGRQEATRLIILPTSMCSCGVVRGRTSTASFCHSLREQMIFVALREIRAWPSHTPPVCLPSRTGPRSLALCRLHLLLSACLQACSIVIYSLHSPAGFVVT